MRDLPTFLPGLAFAVLSVCAGFPSAATAETARLRAGVDIAIPQTNLADEPSLAGTILEDDLVSFRIRDDEGTIVCRGSLQERIVRSTETGRLDFYYRIRDTRGSATIIGITATDFAGRAVRVGSRSDGLGSGTPTRAYRHPAPGSTVVIGGMRVRCGLRQESRFLLIRTDATHYASGGTVGVSAWSGSAVQDAFTPD